jgi:hypothetical protein
VQCLKTSNAAGACAGCGETVEPMHIVSLGGGAMALYGGCCCPVCSAQVSMDWQGEAETLSGEQGSLF